MNFRRSAVQDEPEINLIPFIDVLLVVLIFLMLSTTYSRFTGLQVTLPTADAEKLKDRPQELIVSVTSDGRYAVNRQALEGRSVEVLTARLKELSSGKPDTVVVVTADALSAHQSVVNVLDAARRAVTQATRQAFFGVQSGLAQVKALEAAESSSQLALEATQLGYRVGVRVNLDVLNAQTQLFQTRRDLAKARYDVILGGLKLRLASGQLKPADVAAVNTLLER